MPIYEYECSVCSTRTDKLIKLSERDVIYHCDKCTNKLARVISAVYGVMKDRVILGSKVDEGSDVKYYSTKTGMTITDHNKAEYQETFKDIADKERELGYQKREQDGDK